MNSITENLQIAVDIISGAGFGEAILQQQSVAVERSKLKDLLTQIEQEPDAKIQTEICRDIARHNLMFMDAFEAEQDCLARLHRNEIIFEGMEIVPSRPDDEYEDDEEVIGYEGSRLSGTKQYDPNFDSSGTKQADENASFVRLLDSEINIGEEKDGYHPYNHTTQGTSLGAQHHGCFAASGSPGGRQNQSTEYPTTARASQATPKTRDFLFSETANSIDADKPTTERASTTLPVPRYPNDNQKNGKPARRRKPPKAKSLDVLKLVARSTNTSRFAIHAIDLQLFQPETKGQALWIGRIKFEGKKWQQPNDGAKSIQSESIRFADFTKQEKFKRGMAREVTKSKQTSNTFNDDPWYQELNAYLKFLNYQRAGDDLPEALVSFVKWTEKYPKTGKVKWEHRDDHVVVVLLRNQDLSIHKVQMFHGRYLLEFENFNDMDDNLGAHQAHSCWYKDDYR